jgi:hypothetical protein
VFQNWGGIYAERDGLFQVVAISGQPAPGGGVFSFSTDVDVSIDDGHLAFSSGWNQIGLPFTIYSDVGGSLQRIIGRDDVLFGETVVEVQLGPQGLSGNQIAFYATFTNGNSGIYVATVPEPELALLATFGLSISFSRAFRRTFL